MSNFTPAWFKKGFFNESLFCDDFLSTHQLLYSNGAFFTPDGRMVDTMPLRCEIFEMMREYVGANLAKKVTNVVDVLKLAAQVEDFPPVTDRIALANGTLYLDGTFQEGKPEIVRNRLPVRYGPKAPQPTHWRQIQQLRCCVLSRQEVETEGCLSEINTTQRTSWNPRHL